MPIFNVVVSVVALVESSDEQGAIAKLSKEIERRGLVPMDDDAQGKYANAFRADPDTVEADF